MEKEYMAIQSPDDGLQEKPDWQEIIRQARRDGWIVSYHPFYGWLLEEYVGPGPEAAVPDWIVSLCEGAFGGRKDLTGITLPGRLKFIDRYAFSGCTGLTSVTIPKRVAEIRDDAFYNCTGLSEIKVDAENKYYRAVDGLLLELRSKWKSDEEDGDEDFDVLGLMKPGAYEEEDGDEDPDALDGMEPGAYEEEDGDEDPDALDGMEPGAFEEEDGEGFDAFGVWMPGMYEDDGTEDLHTLCGMKPRAREDGVDGDEEDGDCKGLEKCYVLHRCPPGKAGVLALPEGIRGIGEAAFSGCTGLTRITVPESVLEIGKAAFSGCTSLKDVVLPDSVRKIGPSAFYGCTSLARIVIPGSNTYISPFAFKGCTGLSGVVLPKGIIQICEGAFSGCTGLSGVTFPEGVIRIEEAAFKGCTGLTSVVIPEGVTKIGSEAFSGCAGLTSVVIPEGITEIGSEAFSGCTGLTGVALPESVTEIGEGVFQGCTGLEEIRVAPGNRSYRVINGLLVSLDDCVLHSCPAGKSGMLAVPEGVRAIGGNAFSGCTGLTGVALPESVRTVSKSAFQGCTSLTEIQVDAGNNRYRAIDGLLVSRGGSFLHRCPPGRSGTLEIPESITFIGRYAFEGCMSLAHIIVPGGISEIGKYAFSGCTGLTEITIPEGVAKIGDSAFAGCTGLGSVVIPEGVTEIGSEAFSGCTGLAEVTIRGSVKEIGGSAFSDCTGLTHITLPEGVTEIGVGVFSGCTGLTCITLPGSVTRIGFGAFQGCTGLTEITLPERVAEIDSYAFSGCTGLTEITIRGSVREIGNNVFSGCTGLTHITLPKGAAEIGNSIFYGCTGLTHITLPEGITEIGSYAFCGCTGLTCINIPESVIRIGDGAFWNCISLAGLTIPKGIRRIGRNAFSGCISLCTDIPETVGNDWPEGDEFGEDGFAYDEFDEDDSREDDFELWEDDPLYEDETSDCCWDGDGMGSRDYWDQNGMAAVVLKGATEIKPHAFAAWVELKKVDIPEGVTKIGDDAFRDCWRLDRVDLPESVTEIGQRAFRGCTGLAEVVLPEGIREIGSQTFSNCVSLSHVAIPESVRAIRKGAFEGCKSLSRVTIPEGVRVINSEAFQDCTALSRVDIPKSVRAIFGDTFRGCPGLTIHAPAGSYAEEYAGRLGIKFSNSEEQILNLMPDGGGELLTLEERLKYAAESRASSPEAAVRMVRKFSGIPAGYFFCGEEDLTAMNELTGKFWEHPSVDVDTYHGFSQTFRLAINYDTACRMRQQSGTMPTAEGSCNPCRPIWSAGTVNAVILLGLMLLDHAKGRTKNKDIYHCMRMTLGQYLDALADFTSGKEGKPGLSRTDFRLFGQSLLKSCDGSVPLGDALADILRRYIAAQREFGRLDHILLCMDALSRCLEEQGGMQADSVRRWQEALARYCPGLEGRRRMEADGRYPDPYGHYLALAGEYPEDVPDPGSEGLAAGAVRSQVFLPEYDYSPESLRALAAQTPFRDFRELLEKNICGERMARAMKEINTSAVYLYTLWVEPYLPA